MSDRRYTPRPSLPEGYQYGDAGLLRRSDGVPFATADGRLIVNLPTRYRLDALARVNATDESTAHLIAGHELPGMTGETITVECTTDPGWRAPHENAAAQLKRRQAPQMWTCGDKGRGHWFEGRAENHTPTDRCICGKRTWAEEYAECRRQPKLTAAQLSDIADAHVDACAKALIGINEFNKELDARFAQRTGEEII